jgi:hypothetical protein
VHYLQEYQMKLRIPSMMIRRDGLMAAPYGSAQNFEMLLSARNAPPSAGYAMNPLQQREAMQKESFEQRRADLLAKAAGKAGPSTQWVAQNWLTVRTKCSVALSCRYAWTFGK